MRVSGIAVAVITHTVDPHKRGPEADACGTPPTYTCLLNSIVIGDYSQFRLRFIDK
jgi:hypothetical protein